MLDEFLEFLAAFKNAEGLSPDLQRTIGVETGIEEAVISALAESRIVVVAGSAGSGKTHLLRRVMESLSETAEVLEEAPERARTPFYILVPDATELSVSDRVRHSEAPSSKYWRGTLIAVNEGPLREAARASDGATWRTVADMLHKAQRGLVEDPDPAAPTIIDMSAFDALDEKVIRALLALPLLTEAVDASDCRCDPEDCPRRRAWRQLHSEAVRQRLATTVGLVRLTSEDWLFRDLWDFVADLAVEGDCEGAQPTSVWFWRVFNGGSRISRALRDLVAPASVAMPQVDVRLYYGDWASPLLEAVDGVELIEVSHSGDMDAALEAFAWSKCQAVLTLNAADIKREVLQGRHQELTTALYERDPQPLVKLLNEYYTFGLRTGSKSALDLFVEHGVERRTQLAEGVIQLGLLPSGQLAIRKGQVIINHPGGVTQDGGGEAHFLVNDELSAAFRVDWSRLRLLRRGRTARVADRAQVDLDWDLTQFYENILTGRQKQTKVTVWLCDFRRMTCKTVDFQVLGDPPTIEVA